MAEASPQEPPVGHVGEFRIVVASETVVVATLPRRMDPALNATAVETAQALGASCLAGVRDIVPTYHSVAIHFDPLVTDAARVADWVRREAGGRTPVPLARDVVRIPVHYGGADGPDLDAVAAYAGLRGAEVVRLHAERLYRVYMLGFLPGFAYLGDVDERLAAPRLDRPRTSVAAGSVGIAGRQTGVYPTNSPGGWQIIGRTPLAMFDPTRAVPARLRAGDLVQFEPLTGPLTALVD